MTLSRRLESTPTQKCYTSWRFFCVLPPPLYGTPPYKEIGHRPRMHFFWPFWRHSHFFEGNPVTPALYGTPAYEGLHMGVSIGLLAVPYRVGDLDTISIISCLIQSICLILRTTKKFSRFWLFLPGTRNFLALGKWYLVRGRHSKGQSLFLF